MTKIDLVVSAGGDLRMIFDDRFDPRSVGRIKISRGSHVEPTVDGRWTADLSPVNGPMLGPFPKRSDALTAEVDWLRLHWLIARRD